MGNIEKLAVLIVLFLSAVVLAVSLSDGEDGAVEDPFGAAGAPQGPRPEMRDAVLAAGREPAAAHLPLLDVGGVAEEAARSTPKTLLISRRGLRPSFLDAYMEYTVEEGDTWSGLALRFYSDARMVSNLKIANDDLAELLAGMEILVPVVDLAAEASSRERFQPVERPREVLARPIEAVGNRTRATAYTVVAGDNLSKISQKVFGTEARWAEIYEANRAELDSPDWLTVGMELRIPAEDEFAGVQPPPTSADGGQEAPTTTRVR